MNILFAFTETLRDTQKTLNQILKYLFYLKKTQTTQSVYTENFFHFTFVGKSHFFKSIC